MSLINVPNFLHSFTNWLVTTLAAQSPAVDLNYTDPTQPRALWRNKADEAIGGTARGATDPYSVLRVYGGPPINNYPQPRRSIQCMTIGTSEDLALQQAQAIFDCLFFPASNTVSPCLPLRGLTIPAYLAADNSLDAAHNWLIISLDPLAPPGKAGVDLPRGRPMVSFNFDVGFCQVAA